MILSPPELIIILVAITAGVGFMIYLIGDVDQWRD